MRTAHRPVRRPFSRGLGRPPNPYLALLHGAPAAVWQALPASLRRTFVSRHAERLFGYPLERWTRERAFWRQHVHPEDRARAAEELARHVRGGGAEALRLRYRFLASDGSVKWITDLVAVERDASGRASAVRGVMIDVSDARRSRELRSGGFRRRRRPPTAKRRPVRR